MSDTARLLERINQAIRELQRVRDEVAAFMPATTGNGLDADEATRLRSAAIEMGARVSGDDRIGERDLARLLGIEPESLARRRQEGRAPTSFRMPCGGSRWSYRLDDVGAWLEQHRGEDF